jgi:ribosome-associated protein
VHEIPASELEFTFVRSSGPGGQNVNKVNSKAVLRWNLVTSTSLAPFTRARLIVKLGPRLTRDGDLLVTSDRYRDQTRNRQDCIDKLHDLISQALKVEAPRKATRPTKGSKRRKRESKEKHSVKKKMRGRLD